MQNTNQQERQPENRIIYVGQAIDDDMCGKIMAGLISMNLQSTAPIHMIVNSPGGSVAQLFAIYDVMMACSCQIWTFGVGQVMSAAVPILAAGHKGERRISARARLLIHTVSSGMYGDLEYLKTVLGEAERLQSSMVSILAEHTKLKKEDILKFMDGKDHYFSAKDAIKFGIADKIVS